MCFDEISFDKIAEGDRYLTYLFTQTSYMGGAHGSTIYKGATFRKSDGRRIGWDVVAPDPYAESLQKSIDRGLREYWNLSASDNLKEYLLMRMRGPFHSRNVILCLALMESRSFTTSTRLRPMLPDDRPLQFRILNWKAR